EIEPLAYMRDVLWLLPSWPHHRVLELAPAYRKQTLDKVETQERSWQATCRGRHPKCADRGWRQPHVRPLLRRHGYLLGQRSSDRRRHRRHRERPHIRLAPFERHGHP